MKLLYEISCLKAQRYKINSCFILLDAIIVFNFFVFSVLLIFFIFIIFFFFFISLVFIYFYFRFSFFKLN